MPVEPRFSLCRVPTVEGATASGVPRREERPHIMQSNLARVARLTLARFDAQGGGAGRGANESNEASSARHALPRQPRKPESGRPIREQHSNAVRADDWLGTPRACSAYDQRADPGGHGSPQPARRRPAACSGITTYTSRRCNADRNFSYIHHDVFRTSITKGLQMTTESKHQQQRV